jgi:acyl-CoA synthetase (AMP-forming)/AMP-acid ligase II
MSLDLSVGNLIEVQTGNRWDREKIQLEIGRRISFFRKLGMKQNDRVFLHYGNRPEFFADLLAIWSLAACAIPIDPRFTEFELGILAGSTRPQFSLWFESPEISVAKKLSDSGTRIVDGKEAKDFSPSSFEGSKHHLDQDALILFTSGTTGSPKGVVHTHRSLLSRWISLQQTLRLQTFQRTLCTLPTHFGHGLICNALFPWLSGKDLFLAPPFQSGILMQLNSILDEYEITFLSSVPSLWRFVLKTVAPPQKRTLQRVFCGSAPLSAHLWSGIQKWTAAREVWNAYGITETASWVAGTNYEEFVPEDGLVGKPWGSVIKVLRDRDAAKPVWEMQECETGESGFVWLHTPALMKEYFERPDLTAQVIHHGWFLTGDKGYKDDQDRLFLRGREREEINKGGMKVYPSDIDLVAERFESIVDACAFPCDDPLFGENIGFAFVLREKSERSIQNLYRWMKQHLATHQMPIRWYLVDEIPRNSRGKTNRDDVARHCAGYNSLEVTAFSESQNDKDL